MSKLNIEEQWSSHPTTLERVSALDKLNIKTGKRGDNSAMDLFVNPENICESFTKQLFSTITYKEDVIILDSKEFQKIFEENIDQYTFPAEYNGYYDNKNPNYFDVKNVVDLENKETIETFFSLKKTGMIHKFRTLENDESTLNSILSGDISIKSFNYEGYKYKTAEAEVLIKKIQIEKEVIQVEITENDINIYNFFYNQSKLRGKENELKSIYLHFFNQDEICDNRVKLYNEFVEATNFLRVETSRQHLATYFRILSKIEIKLKSEIKNILETSSLEKEITESIRNNFDKYLARNWCYSANEISDQEYLEVLFTAVNSYNYLISRTYFIEKQNLLNYQISILNR